MSTYVYDGTFDGLLSVIFEAYRRRRPPTRIVRRPLEQAVFFEETIEVTTEDRKARRVGNGLRRASEPDVAEQCYHAFRADVPDVEMTLFRYAQVVFTPPEGAEAGAWLAPVLEVERLAKRVRHEIHRMHAFVRFEQTEGGLYVARVAPAADVLDLAAPHFEQRYPSQRWLIADERRRYAMYYDGTALRRLDVLPENATAEEEADYQKLWRGYFRATTIAERRNLALHRRNLPRRYWRYLTEKRPEL